MPNRQEKRRQFLTYCTGTTNTACFTYKIYGTFLI